MDAEHLAAGSSGAGSLAASKVTLALFSNSEPFRVYSTGLTKAAKPSGPRPNCEAPMLDTTIRGLRLLVALLAFVGCGESGLLGPDTALTSVEAQGSIVLTSEQCGTCTRLHEEFYIVRSEQLPRIRKARLLTYLGTQDGFHFLRSWNKMLKHAEIDHVAIRLDECDVSEPRRIDEEHERRRHRDVEMHDGQCVVR
jgi:hypothetical protein